MEGNEDLRRDLSRVELQIRLHFSGIVNSSAEIDTFQEILQCSVEHVQV